MGKRILTEAHIDRLVELGEDGHSDEYIARALAREFNITVSASAIHWHRIANCAEPSDRTDVKPVPVEPVVEKRGDHVVRRFTVDEDERLKALEAQGLPIAEIARRLDRRGNSIKGRLYTLARHDDRRERAAMQGVA